MGLDENLLALNEDENDELEEEYEDEYEDGEEDFIENESSSALRESKQEAKNNIEDENDDSDFQATSLREQVVMAKARENEEKKKEEEAISSPNPIAQSTAKLVTSSWSSLLGTFLFSILIIDAHVILGTIFGKKFFPRLGDEWAMSKGTGMGMESIKGGEKVNKMMHTVEPIIVVLVNLILLLSIIAILSLIAMIVGFVSNPLKAIASILADTFENWK